MCMHGVAGVTWNADALFADPICRLSCTTIILEGLRITCRQYKANIMRTRNARMIANLNSTA